jgi:hypothetical protein
LRTKVLEALFMPVRGKNHRENSNVQRLPKLWHVLKKKPYETCPERRYFAETFYLALVCDDRELVQRLQNRPAWRASSDPETIERMLNFNRWLKDNAQNTHPPMTLLDTTHLSIEQSFQRAAHWIRSRLPQP